MSLRADILSIVQDFDQYDAQDVEDIDLVMIDCRECDYHDSFEDPDNAELFLRGHRLVSGHGEIDIGVRLQARLREIDCEIRVGDTIEASS